MTEATRGPYPSFDVDAVADEIGARLHPTGEQWVRDRKHPEGGYYVPTSAGDGDMSTMTTFIAEDGFRSARSLTWREVVQIVHDALVAKSTQRDYSVEQDQAGEWHWFCLLDGCGWSGARLLTETAAYREAERHDCKALARGSSA